MTDAFIVDAIRTPIGRYGGALSTVRTDDLAAIPIKALIERNPSVPWDRLDDVHIQGGPGFAGYSDWRIPTVKELQTIVDYEAFIPSIDSAFDNGCAAACTVTTCSCTASVNYWSASTVAVTPASAWSIVFNFGTVNAFNKGANRFVRAVRGGL